MIILPLRLEPVIFIPKECTPSKTVGSETESNMSNIKGMRDIPPPVIVFLCPNSRSLFRKIRILEGDFLEFSFTQKNYMLIKVRVIYY
jgi:hypothetical protein